MVDIKVELKGFGKLSDDLHTFAKRGVPYAIRNSLNNSAFALQKQWRSEVKGSFTLRNDYTVRSIRVEKAAGANIGSMEARTGSVADYMDEQEEGANVTGPVPAPSAAGNPAGSNKRTRLTKAGFRFGGIQVARQGAGLGKRRQNAVAIAVAARRGLSFVLLNRKKGKGQGLFLLKGDGRRTRTGRVGMRLIWSVKKGTMRVKPTPTLARSIHACSSTFQRIQTNAMLEQLKRSKAFGY